MVNLRVLSGNTNSLYRRVIKFKDWDKFDIIIFADARVSKPRLEAIKKSANWIGKVDQFYASLSAEKKPKHGVLIFINCSILLQVIDCNNQHYVRESPRLAYVTANLKGIGLVNIVGIYLPANGGVGEKLRVIRELQMLCQRISTTSDKFILGGDMNIDLDKGGGQARN